MASISQQNHNYSKRKIKKFQSLSQSTWAKLEKNIKTTGSSDDKLEKKRFKKKKMAGAANENGWRGE